MIAFLNYYYHQGISVLKLTLLQRERGTASLGNRKSKKQRPRETFKLVLSDPGGFQQINIRKVIAKSLLVVGKYWC